MNVNNMIPSPFGENIIEIGNEYGIYDLVRTRGLPYIHKLILHIIRLQDILLFTIRREYTF